MKIQKLTRKTGEVYHIGLKLSEAKTVNTCYFDHRIMAGVLDKNRYITTELSNDEMMSMIKRLSRIRDVSKIAKSVLNDWSEYQDSKLKQLYSLTKQLE